MNVYQRILDRQILNVDWPAIQTIDMHTGGEPLRVILSGYPDLKGNSVLDYRRDCMENHDHIRKLLMFEPRGHADMYGCILVPPNDESADFGIIFLHNEGYSTMCGHAIIAISTLAVQMKWLDVKEGVNTLKIDAPCGRIISNVSVEEGNVTGVSFLNVPSFVVGLDRQVQVPGWGTISYDLAYGGAFYAYVDIKRSRLDLSLVPNNINQIISAGRTIKQTVIDQDSDIKHPFEKDLSFLYGTIFIDPENEKYDSRNVCVFADGEVDRCPTGSGVSGRMAIHAERNELDLHSEMMIESITGSVFHASYVDRADYGPFKAVIPKVKGTAHITGAHTFFLDPEDPVKEGFLLR